MSNIEDSNVKQTAGNTQAEADRKARTAQCSLLPTCLALGFPLLLRSVAFGWILHLVRALPWCREVPRGISDMLLTPIPGTTEILRD